MNERRDSPGDRNERRQPGIGQVSAARLLERLRAILTYLEASFFRDVWLTVVTEVAVRVCIEKYRGYVAHSRKGRMRIVMPQPVCLEEAGVGDS